ncbi:DUF948 domain-containing protein [Falsibacillus albus]|uniref:DUF948 domain-containing protein n=1 Tax=Falsibacillus albus TaxID=2478915 RepID=A0A3L7K488_9BACI|nr:DUF948 domain-containing protein [Falsibacillus albus]RLQ97906.1 DUF948 domain-containing protein [Falsibacillus albus]
MIIILYLSAALVAVAFLILVINLSKTLKSLQSTMDSVSTTLDGLETQLQGVTRETTDLLHKTNSLAEDIQDKSEKLNTVVFAVKDVGDSIQGLNHSIKKVSTSISNEVEKNQDKISQVVQWSNVFMEIRDKWKSKRREQEAPQLPVEINSKPSKLREHAVQRSRS